MKLRSNPKNKSEKHFKKVLAVQYILLEIAG